MAIFSSLSSSRRSTAPSSSNRRIRRRNNTNHHRVILKQRDELLLQQRYGRRKARDDTTIKFILIPLCNVIVHIILAISLCSIDGFKNDDTKLFTIADTYISLVTSTSITIVALTFSLTVLSIQIAAQTYSPRLLDDFIQDPISKFAIGVNLGSFTYCYTLSYLLEFAKMELEQQQLQQNANPSKNNFVVPYVAIHFITIQMILVLSMFVLFIHYFVNGFRLEVIFDRAMESSWLAATTLETFNESSIVLQKQKYAKHVVVVGTTTTMKNKNINTKKSFTNDDDDDDGNNEENENNGDTENDDDTTIFPTTLPTVPTNAYKVMADESGYVLKYTLDNVLQKAKELDVIVLYHPHIGEYVAEGTLLAYVWDNTTSNTTASSNVSANDRMVAYANNSNVSSGSGIGIGSSSMDEVEITERHEEQHEHGQGQQQQSGSNEEHKRTTTKSNKFKKKLKKIKLRKKKSLAERIVRMNMEKNKNHHHQSHHHLNNINEIIEEELGILVGLGIELSTYRSGTLDVSLGIQQISDVATRALSAAINDPHTAVQALDTLSTLFGRLSHLEFNDTILYDKCKTTITTATTTSTTTAAATTAGGAEVSKDENDDDEEKASYREDDEDMMNPNAITSSSAPADATTTTTTTTTSIIIRIAAPRRSFNYLLSIVDPIRRYGGADLQVCYRLIRFYGDLGAILKRLKRYDRIPSILAQLEQCMIVCRKNFANNGNSNNAEKTSGTTADTTTNTEFQSIQQLYEHALDLIAWSDRFILTGDESVETDLNDLETTFERPTSMYVDSLPEHILQPSVEG